MEQAGLIPMGKATARVRASPARLRQEWCEETVRLYVDAKGKRYVDKRDLSRIGVPIPKVLADGDGGFLSWTVYVEDEDWTALSIDALVRSWCNDMGDSKTFTKGQRLAVEKLIAELPETLAPVVPIRRPARKAET